MMDRRRAVSLIGISGAIALTGPRPASSQTSASNGKVGLLHIADVTNPGSSIIVKALQQLGYVENQTAILRAAQGDMSRVPALLNELVTLGASVIITIGGQTVKAARDHLRSVPVQVVAVDLESDPVQERFIESLRRPGGRITGLFMDIPDLTGKWLQLLREVSPKHQRVALFWDPTTGPSQAEAAAGVAKASGIETFVFEVQSLDQQAAALDKVAALGNAGVIQLTSPRFVTLAEPFGQLALKYKVPSISGQRSIAVKGGLLSYGPHLNSYFPRAAHMADQLLRGAKAGETPIERPSRFEFVINRKTAEVLTLTIPPIQFMTADEVIE